MSSAATQLVAVDARFVYANLDVELTDVFVSYRKYLLSVAHRSLHYLRYDWHAEDAEDAVQTACLFAWRGRHLYRGESPLHLWVGAIVSNVVMSDCRSRRSRFSEAKQVMWSFEDWQEISDSGSGQHAFVDRMIEEEKVEQVRAAIRSSGPQYRIEIERALNDLGPLIKTNKHRAIQKVQDRLRRLGELPSA